MDNHALGIIYVIAALFWALNAWWKKYQEKQAEEASRGNPPSASAPPQPVATPQSQRYQQVQAEIRRKIAERAQNVAAARANLPPARTVVAPAPARPMATPAQRRVIPVAVVAEPVETPFAAVPVAMSVAPVMAAVYGSTPQTSGQMYVTALQAALADPAAARQAFVFREVFDRPLCMRSPAGGGHDGWA